MSCDTPKGLLNRLVYRIIGEFILHAVTQVHSLKPSHFTRSEIKNPKSPYFGWKTLTFNEATTKNYEGRRIDVKRGKPRPDPIVYAPPYSPPEDRPNDLIWLFDTYMAKCPPRTKTQAMWLAPKTHVPKAGWEYADVWYAGAPRGVHKISSIVKDAVGMLPTGFVAENVDKVTKGGEATLTNNSLRVRLLTGEQTRPIAAQLAEEVMADVDAPTQYWDSALRDCWRDELRES
ncbi:hypothetical protein CYMTET_22191 [Cymbomonas tetramitiformis]|uniref:ZMYM2-like/QRICH1 C-terminal domain-containing protein n=1 Tax=Cymbomonas tetramitiformis TaxID=36881 RepID=A0AAE0G0G1_9CHLO|nr:hypothetical protein CYMTET_22191 [Cymbomonas tetramitiformis]